MMQVGYSVDGWILQSLVRRMQGVCELYHVCHEDKREGLLTLYEADAEPDAQIYAVIEGLSRLHTPDIVEVGRWQGRAYEVMEALSGETLEDLGIVLKDKASFRTVVAELGSALHEFSENGLRHRGICPEVLLVRTRDPLDLVIGGFGSACLSAYDLEVVSPLNESVYMAPEAVMGAVSPASDWWSLGVVLLEQLTEGLCFEGRGAREAHTFLLHTLTYGVAIPKGMEESLRQLLAGLLTFDHQKRWQWPEVKAWLAGEDVKVDAGAFRRKIGTYRKAYAEPGEMGGAKAPIVLGSLVFNDPRDFALAVACREHWSQGLEVLKQGTISLWIEGQEGGADRLNVLKRIAEEGKL
ncbi:MAG: protein kinase domain-containing protein, partial [Saezia sp.]